jgi:hypothetical protein
MSLFEASLTPALDANGSTISGATWNFYASGTTTPLAVYADAAFAVSLGSVVKANSAGRFPAIYFDDANLVRAVLKFPSGGTVTRADIDPVGTEGFKQLGNGAVGRTVQSKLRDFINVLDFGAPTDGVTDAYPAFVAAFNAAPAGGTIYVPNVGTGYYLSANPDPVSFTVVAGIGHNNRSKHVNWQVDTTTSFFGPGVGLPDTGLKFLSPITNPYNQTFGSNVQYDFRNQKTLNGGALIGDTRELVEDFGYAYPITGNLTTGSATITGVGTDLTSQIKRGDRIESAVTGWPQVGQPFMRVWDVTVDSVTFGVDAGAGPAGPTPWSGASATGSFTIYKKQWMAIEYRGITTGGPNSKDMAYGIRNDVINLTGAPANAYEIDLIAINDGGGLPSRGIFMTGHGEGNAIMYAVDIQRAGAAPWTVGVAMRSCDTGVYINARQPFSIDTEYFNGKTGAPETIANGLHFNNAPTTLRGLFEGRQLANNAPGISIWRNTDTGPAGDFVQGYTAAGAKVMFIDVLGGAHFTTLQLDQVRSPTSDVQITGFITIIGADGQPIKLATVA